MKIHNPDKLPTILIKDVKFTQENLKDLTEVNYDKLKKSIEKHGFAFPLAVWTDKDDTKWVIDGHQRIRVLKQEGWLEPVPYISIPAKTLREATELLLKITSQYGTITQEGLDTYLAKYKIEDIVIDDIAFDKLPLLGYYKDGEMVDDPQKEWSGMPEFEHNDMKPTKQIIVSFGSWQDYNAFGDLIDQTLTQDTRSIWYPKLEKETMKDKEYAEDQT